MPEQITVYHSTCLCGVDSGGRASSELAERWFVDHVPVHHPEHVGEVTRSILAGENKPVDVGHHHLDEEGIITSTCRVCREQTYGRSDDDGTWLWEHWMTSHAPEWQRRAWREWHPANWI